MGNKWTHIEDSVLRNEVESFKEDETISWTHIARRLSGRSNKDCRKRWQKIHGQWHRGAWSETEDTKLKQAVGMHGNRWKIISDAVGTRTADQCHKRWRNTLNPELNRSEWTRADDDCLLLAVTLHGRNWSYISREWFPTRSPLELSNKYASHSQSSHPLISSGTVLQPVEECHSGYTNNLLNPQLENYSLSSPAAGPDDVSEINAMSTYTQVSYGISPGTISSSSNIDIEHSTDTLWELSQPSISQHTSTNSTSFSLSFVPDAMFESDSVTDPPNSATTSLSFDSNDFETARFSLGSPSQPNARNVFPGALLSENETSEFGNSSSLLNDEMSNWQSIQYQGYGGPCVAEGNQPYARIQTSGSAEQHPRPVATNSPDGKVTLVLENVDPDTREKVLQLMYQKGGAQC